VGRRLWDRRPNGWGRRSSAFSRHAIVRMLRPCLSKASLNASSQIECVQVSFHIMTRGHEDQAITNTVRFSILKHMIVKGPYWAALCQQHLRRQEVLFCQGCKTGVKRDIPIATRKFVEIQLGRYPGGKVARKDKHAYTDVSQIARQKDRRFSDLTAI
jgi:hypothetical protein